MNKYIYKVRFFIINKNKLCINIINFWQTTSSIIKQKGTYGLLRHLCDASGTVGMLINT